MARRGKPREDLSGRRYGRWTVISEGQPRYHGKSRIIYWTCRCDCGVIREVCGNTLKNGDSTSCGCFHNEVTGRINRRHGKTGSRVYRIWQNMLNRCRREKDEFWHCYGGRGITVCERWKVFENFLDDMGEPPGGLSLERIDSNGPYSPENCRWASMKEQQRNRRNNHLLCLNGKSQCLSAWAEELGMKVNVIQMRLAHGWPFDEALSISGRR